jgi:hypothetical protein
VDGAEVQVYRTGDGLVGIDLPEGTYRVTLRFLPDYFIYSCIISGASVILFITIIVLSRVFKKRGIKVPTVKGLLRLADNDDWQNNTDFAYEQDEIEEGSGDTVNKIEQLLNGNIHDQSQAEKTGEDPQGKAGTEKSDS